MSENKNSPTDEELIEIAKACFPYPPFEKDTGIMMAAAFCRGYRTAEEAMK